MDVLSEVTGTVWKVVVNDGDTVQEGQTLVIVESMKMEIPVEAPASGQATILVQEGSAVEEGMIVARIGAA
ncbi:acetyl-CoA carboxylase biotin carboxyl carrier protein [Advenella incenata]|jgi:acetyl-CoA carboxylase biotin carboxyl carrier protein|uniref:Acetyl-CoA carboxylase biotin carboxyl carrier protein n=1 Tax=Advenella incenata TaxID=267800 RepID=A0A4Q7VTF8_9BURK|nr:acetyl-CoA carboxylase biotin carboxyl carrier protein subunit [Advenella incenata]RZT99674.1 acetyl-CoA carboxylase biotin carboxyl carrier protein [Advenella incenata]